MELSDRPNVQFKLDLGGLTEAICNVDRKELARALSNLVNNAVRSAWANWRQCWFSPARFNG